MKDELREAAWKKLTKSAEYNVGNCCDCFENGVPLGFDHGFDAGYEAGQKVDRERIADELHELSNEPMLRAKLWAYADKLRGAK